MFSAVASVARIRIAVTIGVIKRIYTNFNNLVKFAIFYEF